MHSNVQSKITLPHIQPCQDNTNRKNQSDCLPQALDGVIIGQ